MSIVRIVLGMILMYLFFSLMAYIGGLTFELCVIVLVLLFQSFTKAGSDFFVWLYFGH